MSKPGAIIIEGHVQGLSNTRSLGKAGIQVFVVDKNDCIARHSKHCKGFFLSPDFEDEGFADFLLQLAEKHELKNWVLIPSNDHAVYALSRHKTRLETIFKVITPGLDIIEKIYDKGALIKVASEAKIPFPYTQFFKTINDEVENGLSFPVLTKGRYGLSFYKSVGKKAFLAYNANELRTQLSEINSKYPLENTFTQDLIPFTGKNKTISFTAFCVDGEIKTHWSGLKLREHPIQFGTATYAKSVFVPECYEQSVPLLRELKYTGVCEVEYLLDPRDGQYKLIEINARTWLWVGLARACGVDYAQLLYDYMQDNPIEWPQTYDTNVAWYNPFTDFVYALIAMTKGKLNMIGYLKSIHKKKKVNALFEKGDLKPGVMYLFSIFLFIRKR